MFIVLYTVLTRILPVENKLIEATSKDNIRKLNSLQWIVFFLLNQDWKNDEHIHQQKTTQ